MSRSKSSGCLIFIVVYILSLIAMYFATTPPEETQDFSNTWFYVAGVERNNPERETKYRALQLVDLNSGKEDLSNITFLLPERSVMIDIGDIHHVNVLEEHGDWQLIEYHYSNTHASISTYRAYDDRIEPVSYKLTSHVGQAFFAFLLLIPASILSAIITAVLNWRAKRGLRQADA